MCTRLDEIAATASTSSFKQICKDHLQADDCMHAWRSVAARESSAKQRLCSPAGTAHVFGGSDGSGGTGGRLTGATSSSSLGGTSGSSLGGSGGTSSSGSGGGSDPAVAAGGAFQTHYVATLQKVDCRPSVLLHCKK